jgi:fibronectin-binding autotransporter adhesin
MRARLSHKLVALFLNLLAISALAWLAAPALAQITSTWTGGAGNWSDCPPSGNALWDTCSNNPPQFPNGNFNAVIDGGPVSATSASIVNLTIGSGGSLVFPPSKPSILDITGTSMLNNGSISIAGSDGLQIIGPTKTTLSGSGSVTMAGSNFTGSGNPTLVVQQTIQGQGFFSLGLNLTNQSLINATGGTLSLQPNSAINTGTMQASSGSTLAFTNGLAVPYNNVGGVIKALNGGTVRLENGVYSGGTLTTTGTGVIQASASAVLNGLTNTGTLQVLTADNATLENAITNTGGVIQVPSSTLFMSGNVTLNGPGSLIMSGTARLQPLSAGSTLTNQQIIHGSGTIFQLPLANDGFISADTRGNTLTLAGSTITNNTEMSASGGGILQIQNDETVQNAAGIILADYGSVVNLSGIVKGGKLTTNGAGVIDSQNGTLDGTVNVLTNAGTLNVNNFDLFIQGTINNTGTIALTGNSCVILNKPSTLTGSGKLTMASTTCMFGSGNAFTNSSLIQGAGTIGDSNPMPITNASNGTILANQASPLSIVPDATGFTNNGKLLVNPGSTLNIHAPFKNLSSGGTLSSGTYSVTGVLGLPNSIVTNAAHISLTGASARILNDNTSTNALSALSAITTMGSLSLASGQVLTTSTHLTNAGAITIGAGSGLDVHGSFTQTAGTSMVDGLISATGGLAVQKGSLSGRGMLAGVVNSSATVIAGDSTTKAGKLTVSGTYTQSATGVLDVAIGGTTVGTQYSQLAVSHGVSLNGTLNIKRINGFVPAIGTVFTILTGGAVTGQFAKVNGSSINSSEHFEINYTATEVTLKVVSGP